MVFSATGVGATLASEIHWLKNKAQLKPHALYKN